MNICIDKIWIVGAKGHVGSAFAKILDSREVEILMTDIDDVDVTDIESVRSYADLNRPDIIINCSGLTDVAMCAADKDRAFKVNALGARNLSVVARKLNSVLVQISTDDIFNGKSESPIDEFVDKDPISVYGRSKLAGENFVKNLAPKHLIIRSSWVYGMGNDFVSQILEKAKTEKQICVAENQFASPTSAKEVAKTIYRLIEAGEYGVYHVTTQGYCSRYEFAQEIVKQAGLDVEIVRGSEKESSEHKFRPTYAVLDNMMLRISNIEQPGKWQDVLKEYLEECK